MMGAFDAWMDTLKNHLIKGQLPHLVLKHAAENVQHCKHFSQRNLSFLSDWSTLHRGALFNAHLLIA